ncbi:methyltransferase domain-containing protein [Streptomyces sp. NPDC000987]|uniref:methyltransferase domain-containing protein n=1 Tax=Streptomyces sp. NPDC000987 TaxID=3154374 RepID=UPI00331F3605
MNRLRTRVHALDRRRRHRSAARALLRVLPEPESWLDVGTGYADFPHAAREFFPYTAFDGIDPTARVEYARRAGRVEEAYAGQVTDPHITSLLRARYDVVTLLRHRSPGPPDPGAELRAALAVLRPGGHLLVEVPGMRSDGVRAHLEAQGCAIVTPAGRFPDLLPPGRRVIARR